MAYVIDTGILLRAFETTDPHHQTVRQMLKASRQVGWELITFPQNIAEMWVVSTRPVKENGYGQTPEATLRRIAFLERVGAVKKEHESSYERWKELIEQYHVQGKTAHDTRLVAQMFSHGLETIISLNPKDFRRYRGLTVLTPKQLLSITEEKQ